MRRVLALCAIAGIASSVLAAPASAGAQALTLDAGALADQRDHAVLRLEVVDGEHRRVDGVGFDACDQVGPVLAVGVALIVSAMYLAIAVDARRIDLQLPGDRRQMLLALFLSYFSKSLLRKYFGLFKYRAGYRDIVFIR